MTSVKFQATQLYVLHIEIKPLMSNLNQHMNCWRYFESAVGTYIIHLACVIEVVVHQERWLPHVRILVVVDQSTGFRVQVREVVVAFPGWNIYGLLTKTSFKSCLHFCRACNLYACTFRINTHWFAGKIQKVKDSVMETFSALLAIRGVIHLSPVDSPHKADVIQCGGWFRGWIID